MRSVELRVRMLRTNEALAQCADTIHPRHLRGMPSFCVGPHGFWTKKDDNSPKLSAHASGAESDDPGELDERRLKSMERARNVTGFDTSAMVGVETTILDAAAGLLLK